LQPLTGASLATEDFPFMASRRIALAGVDCLALRVSFTGDLGWELHCAAEDQARLYEALIAAGRGMRAGPVGSRALMSLRLEKGYGSWGREYGPEYWPQEAGLDRLCRMEKDFLNRGALEAVIGRASRERLVMMALDQADVTASNADATGGEPIFQGGRGVGRVTSGGYGHWVGQSLALGYVAPDVAAGAEVEVMVLGRPHKARILHAPPFDPDGLRLRA
jgi:dimethylglycine dehydrogenase